VRRRAHGHDGLQPSPKLATDLKIVNIPDFLLALVYVFLGEVLADTKRGNTGARPNGFCFI
jgi:hypothetical protein